MALSGRQTAGAALAGTPEAGAAARIARCSHSHETLHRSRVTVPLRDRPGIIILSWVCAPELCLRDASSDTSLREPCSTCPARCVPGHERPMPSARSPRISHQEASSFLTSSVRQLFVWVFLLAGSIRTFDNTEGRRRTQKNTRSGAGESNKRYDPLGSLPGTLPLPHESTASSDRTES